MKLIIPQDLKDIKLRQIIEWAAEPNKDNNKLISIFCNISIDAVKYIPLNDHTEISELISNVLKMEPEFHKTFKHKGIEFGFMPNMEKMSAGEYIDLESYIHTSNTWHNAMAVMYRPVVKIKRNWFRRKGNHLYSIEQYQGSEQYNKILLDSPAEYFLGAQLFFYNLSNELLVLTLESSQGMISKETAQIIALNRISMLNGGGIKAFMQPGMETPYNSKK